MALILISSSLQLVCADLSYEATGLPKTADNQAGYIAMIQTLRRHFKGAAKPYLITGAPQCVVPDANMGQMIAHAQFDIIWIQYYNTAQCSARNWVTANPNYTSTGVEEPSGFSFNAWETFLAGTSSSKAKLYIGLPGSTSAAGSTYYLNPTEASSLIKAYYCKPNFGGIMIWEATYAENNNVGCGETYYQAVKDILVGYSQDGALGCVVPPKNPPPTSSKSSCTVSSTTTSTTSTSPTITPTPPCTEVYVVVSGDYCYLIWTEFGITEAQLYAWNPTLDTNCDLSIGQVLCVAQSSSISPSVSTTSPTTTTGVSITTTSASTSATPTTCTKYYTVVSGDYCYLIWTEFGITQAQLYAFNPTLDANCDLAIGQVLCVSESPTTTSSSLSITTSSTTTSASATPSACTKYYTVVSGDYCYLISTNFGITLAQLYAFNPSLDTNCDLAIGQVLRVSETSLSSSSTSTSSVISTSSGSYTSSSGSKSSTTSTSTSTTSTSSSSKSTSTSSSFGTTTTSSFIRITTTSSTFSVPTTTRTCQKDNCLRQLQHSSATAFCATYTNTINTASTGLPASVSQCQSSYARISSACSCLEPVGSTTTSSTSTSSTKTNDSSVIVYTTTSSTKSSTSTSSTKTNDSSVVVTTLKTSTSTSSTVSASVTP